MYEMSEEFEEPEPIKIDEMRDAIADKKIVIIGGNVNWVKKISQIFPDWRFVSANVSSALSSSMVVNSDKVYFFTDTLGHSNYYKYMQVIRECEIPFGFLHGVNIEGNIGYIYNDLLNES